MSDNIKASRELYYLDVMRAIVCMGVFVEHITACFNMELLAWMRSLTGPHIFSFLTDGRLAINTFCVLSGFLIAYNNLDKNGINYGKVQYAFLKRLIYLFVPSAIVCIMAYVFMKAGLIFNYLAYENGADAYIVGIYNFEPTVESLMTCFKELIFGGGYTRYAPQLWTICFEVLGGTACFVIILLFGEKKILRFGAYAVCLWYTVFVLQKNYFEAFFCGMIVYELCNLMQNVKWNKQKKLLLKFSFVLFLECATLCYFKFQKIYFVPVFLALAVGAGYFAFGKDRTQNKLVSWIKTFGSYSYSFYLIHFLMIVSLGSVVYTGLRQIKMSVYIEYILLFLIIGIVTYVCARLFQDYIIRKMIHIVKWIYGKLV